MAAQQNFRTAFNGFNREDVVHYIEYLNSKHNAELNQLKSELDLLRNRQNQENSQESEAAAKLEETVGELTARCESAQQELDTLRQENEALEKQLGEAMTAGTEMEEMLNSALAERDALAAKLEAAQTQRQSFESRMEEELAAYRRAERTERVAKERAEQMYRQANGIIADATVKVDEAAAQIGQLSESVMAQLAQLQQAVSGSNSALKDAAAGMFAIRPETEE